MDFYNGYSAQERLRKLRAMHKAFPDCVSYLALVVLNFASSHLAQIAERRITSAR